MLQVGRRLYGPKGRQQQGVLASVAGWTFNGPERQSGEKYGHVELSNIIGVPSLSLRATRHRRHHHFIIIIIGFIRAAHVQQLSLETGLAGECTHTYLLHKSLAGPRDNSSCHTDLPGIRPPRDIIVERDISIVANGAKNSA